MLIREVRAANSDGDALVLALHRELTVVAGLRPDEQVELADILAAMVYGRTEDLGGRVDVGGEELSAQLWGRRVGEDFDDIDVFVRRSDVTLLSNGAGVDIDATESDVVAAARSALVRTEKALPAAERDLELARRRAEEARAAVATLGPRPAQALVENHPDRAEQESLEELRATLEESVATLAAAQAEVEAADERQASAGERAAEAQVACDAALAALANAEAGEAAARSAEEEARRAAEATGDVHLGEDAEVVDLGTLRAASDDARRDLELARAVHRQATEEADARRADLAAAREDLVAAEAATQESESRRVAEARATATDEAGEAELVQAAEVAMAEAEVAAAEVARAAQAVDEARRELERARAAEGPDVPAAASGEELAALDRKSLELDEALARARAEESLFAGFAESNGPVEREGMRTGRSGRAVRRAERRAASAQVRTDSGGGAVSQPGSGEPDGGADVDASELEDGDSAIASDAEADLAEVEAEARRATAHAAELRAELEAMRERAAGAEAGASPEDRRAEAAARRSELEREIAACGVPLDTAGVLAAAAELRHLPSATQLDEARRLLAEVDALVTSRGKMTVRSAPTWLVDAARTALEEARVELARAEEMARPMRVSVEEAAQFERIHAAVVEAEAKADRRFGGPMARRRLEKALADERELLLKFGLPSYTAFLLRTMPISSDSAGARHLDEARRAMADAEAVWEELHQAEYPEDLAALEQQEARILAQAAALLGADRMKDADVSSPAATLRSVRALLVETTASDGDTEAASRRLAEALEAAFGLTVDVARTETHELLAQADEQIAASDAVAARRGQLALQLEAVLTDIEAIDRGMAADTLSQIPDATAIADAEAAATAAEELAEAARHRLERTAIAAGIAPAAAAVAADAAVLDAGSADAGSADAGSADAGSADARPADAGPADSGPSGAPSTDQGRADSAAGEVDWEAQAVAEVERSQQEIDALGLEMAALDARREALYAERDRTGTAPDEGGITRLSETLDAAETTLSAARREADEAAARAAAAIESLSPTDRDRQARPVQEEQDEEDEEGAGARRDALAESVATLEAAVSAAEAEAVIAAAAVADAERIAAEAAAALEAGEAAVDVADIALAQARHAHDQAEAAHRDAAAACADAEARRAAAAAAVDQARNEVERAGQERDASRAQLVDATARRDAQRSAVEGHRQALSDAEGVASVRAAEAEAAAELAAREAARQAEQWQQRYDEAVAAEAEASAEETRATRRVADALAELDAARVVLADAEAGMIQHAASSRGAALQTFVQERLAAARSKPRLGTVPMILLDPFDAGDLAPVAPLLAAAAEEVQMVYLTAEDEVLRWADALGPDRALVLRFGDPVVAQG